MHGKLGEVPKPPMDHFGAHAPDQSMGTTLNCPFGRLQMSKCALSLSFGVQPKSRATGIVSLIRAISLCPGRSSARRCTSHDHCGPNGESSGDGADFHGADVLYLVLNRGRLAQLQSGAAQVGGDLGAVDIQDTGAEQAKDDGRDG